MTIAHLIILANKVERKQEDLGEERGTKGGVPSKHAQTIKFLNRDKGGDGRKFSCRDSTINGLEGVKYA